MLAAFADSISRMEPAAYRAWQRKLKLLYGDLGGQRRVRKQALREKTGLGNTKISIRDLLLASQTYFAFCTQLLSLLTVMDAAPAYLGKICRLPETKLRDFLSQLARNQQLAERGLCVGPDALGFDWYLDAIDQDFCQQLRGFLQRLQHEYPDQIRPWLAKPGDPFGALYCQIMDADILHVAGEFYTPWWLAQMLLEQVQWQPAQSLIDPFGGSGIFLKAALARAARLGFVGAQVLPQLHMIDMNPAACCAARANLVIALAGEAKKGGQSLNLPVHCKDALAPAWKPKAKAALAPAAVLATNPPWVGWEYMSRPYRRQIEPAWRKYQLFTATGREAAFLKEDLSTLALVAACDTYLQDGGHCVCVLRKNCMNSQLAAGGLRRLSIHAQSDPLQLQHVRCFDGIRVFAGARVEACTWQLSKGRPTRFPVPASRLRPKHGPWQPSAHCSLAELRQDTVEEAEQVIRSRADDPASRWIIGDATCVAQADALQGTSAYRARTGVFTGGANAVFYLQRTDQGPGQGTSHYRNVVRRAKRKAPEIEARLEDDLVYEVIRGRDLHHWQIRDSGLLLCPHSPETRMQPLPAELLKSNYPHSWSYLNRMQAPLKARRGFAGWEKSIHEKNFYALQRIGAYTFAPYKVAWRYIAKDLSPAVIGPDDAGRPRLPNDKIVYVGLDQEQEAFYLCALLSSAPLRWQIRASSSSTQHSPSIIAAVNLAAFDPGLPAHIELADSCRRGHAAAAQGDPGVVSTEQAHINDWVAKLYGFSQLSMQSFESDLAPS